MFVSKTRMTNNQRSCRNPKCENPVKPHRDFCSTKCARLINPPGDSSVRVMLARLEKKGFVKHQRQGLRYVYSATASPAVAKRTALQRYLQTFFGGSRQEMLTALITESRLSDDEFDALKAEIDRVRSEKKKQS